MRPTESDLTLLRDQRIGFAMTGSFCTFSQVFLQAERLAGLGCCLQPIFSYNVYNLDTRFFPADQVRARMEEISGREIWHTLQQVEPIGPKKILDLLIVAPCTATTLGKLAAGIFDTPVVMAVKSQLRNERPVLLAVSTNDGLGASARSIGALATARNLFFVPYEQDDPVSKPASLVARMELIPEAAAAALAGRQLPHLYR